MKQSRNRGRGNNSRRRGNTPAVICLPQAKPPVTPPRKEPETLRAFALPRLLEPLAVGSQAVEARARASARKAVKKIQAESTARPAAAESMDIAPLPRNRSLAVQPRSLMVAMRHWVRKMISKPKKVALKVDKASARTQVRALRVEVAQLQRSLDQLMAQLREAQ